MRALSPVMLLSMLLLGVIGCSATPSTSDDAGLVIHASSPVWGAVAAAVAGDVAQVTSTPMSANQDPHSYEPSAQDKLAFSKAKVVLLNGGGYDEWAQTLVDSLPTSPQVINGVELAEHGAETADEADHEGHDHANEHVFQSVSTVQAVAADLAEKLSAIDSPHAEKYRANAAAFSSQIGEELARAKAELSSAQGASVLAVEAVSSLLVHDLGLADVTPEAFVEQSETDDGPSVAVLLEAEKLISGGKVDALLVNAQTGDAASTRLQQAAQQAAVPIVEVHETLPEGITTYQQYLALHLDALVKALA